MLLRARSLFQSFVVLFVLIAQLPSASAQARPAAQVNSYSISGRVTDPFGDGIGGVMIFATPDQSRVFLPIVIGSTGSKSAAPGAAIVQSLAPAGYSAITDANGNYTIASLPAGTYRLQAKQNSILFTPASSVVTVPGNASQNFQISSVPPVIDSNTEVITSLTNAQLQSVSQDGSIFTFSGGSTQVQGLQVGDVMVSEPTSKQPNGYLRKVLGVNQQNGAVVVQTAPTVLEEAVQDGLIYVQDTLTPADIVSANNAPGVRMQQASSTAATFSFTVSDVVLYDEDGDPKTEYDQVKANGNIDFEMDYSFYLYIEDSQLRSLRFTNKNTVRDTIEVKAEIDLASVEEEKVLVSQKFSPIVYMIGPVPVVLIPTMDVVVGVDGSVSVGISTSVSHELSMQSGVEYVRGLGWQPISELTNTLTFKPPQATLKATVKGYFGVRFNLYLYGVAGPYVRISPYLEFTVAPLEAPWWVLAGGVEVPAGFRVADELQEVLEPVGVELDDYEVAAINFRMVLAQATVLNTTERISVSSSGEQANNSSINPVISADGRYVVFQSYASNLVAGDTNETEDVFVYDNQTKQIQRVLLSLAGEQALSTSEPAISADGHYIAVTANFDHAETGVYIYNLVDGQSQIVSVSSSGEQANNVSDQPSISADGRYVAFRSSANNLVDCQSSILG